MQVIASMFDTRARAEDAVDRLVAARCPRDAITFLPESELVEVVSSGSYDWRKDKWGLWRGLATFEMMSKSDRFNLAEGMGRGGSVLLVAVQNEDAAEHFGNVLVEAGAIDLDELERDWRENGWKGFDGDVEHVELQRQRRAPAHPARVRVF